MIPIIRKLKCSWIIGIVPKKNPAYTSDADQRNAQRRL
jgi:hypothetical protein